MDELFRFVNLRPPQSVPQVGISIAAETPLQSELGSIRGHENPWPEMVKTATDFVNSIGIFAGGADRGYVKDISSLHFHTQFAAFRVALTDPNQHFDLASLRQAILNIFGMAASSLIADTSFQTDKERVFDSILAIFIAPVAHRGPLAALVEIAQLIDLVQRVAAGDTKLNETGAVQEALTRTILLPPALFPIRRGLYQPVGIGDLLVVKQHLKRYELGEISHIENILQGESKKHTTKHTLTNEQTFVTETEKTTETTRDLQTTERFELKAESENTIKEDTSVKAGVSLSAKYGDVQLSTNTDVAYSNSKTDSTKTSVDKAKDVTSRATVKVTERVRQQQTTHITETFEEADDHGFDNAHGTHNVIGVYQWVNKIYEAQIFNYGKRQLFDIMIPEPAAFLLDSVTEQGKTDSPIAPKPPVVIYFPGPPPLTRPLTPADLHLTQFKKNPDGSLSLDPLYYGKFLAQYGVVGVDAPPTDSLTVSKAFSAVGAADGTVDERKNLVQSDVLPIKEGYKAEKVEVQADYRTGDITESKLSVFVGNKQFPFTNQDTTMQSATLDIGEVATIPVAVEYHKLDDYGLTIDIQCKVTDQAIEQWQVKTHAAIIQAYNKQLSDYEEKLAARAFQKGTQGTVGGNPDRNRQIERTEIKKACIALLSGYDLLAFNGIKEDQPNTQPGPSNFPRPDEPPWQPMPPDGHYGTVEQQGRIIRFFEQAFEWEQMTYFFYPYYWGRKQTWYGKVLKDNDDPIFAEFLNAGEARVVIPVRPIFDKDLVYFLMTGQIWGGADLPDITDTDYLPITEEIKESANAPGDEKPQGDPWEVRLPTTLIKLRADGKRPGWTRPDPKKWEWVPETSEWEPPPANIP